MAGRTVLCPGLGGGYPFKNFMKVAGSFDQANFNFQQSLNKYGYPFESPTSLLSRSITTPTRSQYSGSWYIAWRGQFGTGSGASGVGGVTLAMTQVAGAITIGVKGADSSVDPVVSNNSGSATITLTGTNGYVEFTPAANSSTGFKVSFLDRNSPRAQSTIQNITKIAICRSDKVGGAGSAANAQACLDLTDDFDPAYIALKQEFNPLSLRFIALSRPNGNNRSRFAYDTPLQHATYQGDQFYTDPNESLGVWAGDLSYDSGTDTYSCSAPTNWEGLVQGSTIQAAFSNNNSTTTPKLNVGGTGDKTILHNGAYPLTVNRLKSTNSFATFIYDVDIDAWLFTEYTGSGNPNAGLTAAWPLLTQIRLCNEVGCGGWFHIPYFFDDASVTAMVNTVEANLTGGDARFELANETFDEGSFPQVFWLRVKSRTLGFPSGTPWSASAYSGGLPVGDNDDYCNLRIRQMMEAAKNAWPGGKRIMADFVIRTAVGFKKRLHGINLTIDSSGRFTTGTTSATLTGTTSGTRLSAVSGVTGAIVRGMAASGSGIAANTFVADFDSSSFTNEWQSGDITLSQSVSVGHVGIAITFSPGGTGNAIAADYTQAGNRPGDFIDEISAAMYARGNNVGYQASCYTRTPGCQGAENLETAKNITDISIANPGVFTVASHGYSNGDRVKVNKSTGVGTVWNTLTSNCYGMVANKAANTFELTNVWISTGLTAIFQDFTGLTYTSGGTVQRMASTTVGLNGGGLLTAADDNASVDPVRIASAMAYMDVDYTAGYESNYSYFQGKSDVAVYWTGITGRTIGLAYYEGAPDFFPLNNGVAGNGSLQGSNYVNILGIDSSYYSKIGKLVQDYKYSDNFKNAFRAFLDAVMAFPNTVAVSHFLDTQNAFLQTFTGGISDGSGNAGTILNVTVASGILLYVGLALGANSVDPETVITEFISGTGGTGTYRVNKSQLIAAGTVIVPSSSVATLVGQWALFPGDRYSKRYKSFDTFVEFNNYRRSVRLTATA